MLCNDGGTEAFKVQIREIRFKSGIAEFSEIPQIRHGHRSAVTIYISAPEEGKEAPYGVYDLELLMVEEIKNRAETSDLSPLETKCDIFYEDYSKRRFTTQATSVSQLEHLVFGSVAEKVVQLAECPVLTLRVSEKQASP